MQDLVWARRYWYSFFVQDYSLRAKDHNEKKRRMKALRQKVAERNPDEFAFGMMSSTTKNGIKITNRGVQNGTDGPLSMDMAKLLKTQDATYLQTILQQTRNERERVEKEAIIAGVGVDVKGTGPGIGRRTAFDEDGNALARPQDLLEDDDDSDFDSDDSMGEDEANTSKLPKDQLRIQRQQKRSQQVLSRWLETLVSREKQLSRALDHLDSQRAKIHNTVGGVNKSGVKFKLRERKR